MNLHAILSALASGVWCIEPRRLQALAAMANAALASGKLPEPPQLEAEITPTPGAVGSVGILPIVGTLVPRGDQFSMFFGEAPVDRLTAKFNQLVAAPDVKTILLWIDSPGGMVQGIQEFADVIFAARSAKRIVAIANYTAASAAYWLGSQAHEFIVAPSGWVGSIGAYFLHLDWSKAYELAGVKATLIKSADGKGEFSDFQPLSAEDTARLQAMVEESHDLFIKAVARGRGVSANQVRNGFGDPAMRGRVYTATEAQKAGVVDRIATLDATLLRLISGSTRGGSKAETVRQLEAALRDGAGFSHSQAKQLATKAAELGIVSPRDVEETEQQPQADPRDEGGIHETAQAFNEAAQLISRSTSEAFHERGTQSGP